MKKLPEQVRAFAPAFDSHDFETHYSARMLRGASRLCGSQGDRLVRDGGCRLCVAWKSIRGRKQPARQSRTTTSMSSIPPLGTQLRNAPVDIGERRGCAGVDLVPPSRPLGYNGHGRQGHRLGYGGFSSTAHRRAQKQTYRSPTKYKNSRPTRTSLCLSLRPDLTTARRGVAYCTHRGLDGLAPSPAR